jgi:hypothetical protein
MILTVAENEVATLEDDISMGSDLVPFVSVIKWVLLRREDEP